MSKTSPTKRSLDLLRRDGWECQVVERWIPYAKVRKDLFGFIDIVAICERRGIIGVQTTTLAHMNERVAKILAEPRSQTWMAAGGKIVVHGWAMQGPRGKKHWLCKAVDFPETGTKVDITNKNES